MTWRRLLTLALIVASVACSTSKKKSDQKFLDEVAALSKQQIMERGNALFKDKKWEDARRFYSFLADSFPNDPLGRQAALRVADTFYQRKTTEGLTEAQLRYKDFSNRFPNDPNRPYALLMLGRCNYQQSHGPLRDLTPIRDAAESFRQVVELYPDSAQAGEARDLLNKCTEDLASHEYLVARYYFNVHAYLGARMRLDYLLATYPKTTAAHDGAELLKKVEEKLAAVGGKKSKQTPEKRAPEAHSR
jgi:outer membrane protein assembly factor BamD